ncbi:hypothetical protein ACLBWH_15780 [Sphingomonas sp. M6A6_1c]
MLARRQVICSYNGYHREICVHTIGMSGGKEMILGYQFAGENNNPPQSDEQRWRCMEVAKLEGITVRDGPWRTSTNHSKAQTCVKDVDLEVTS